VRRYAFLLLLTGLAAVAGAVAVGTWPSGPQVVTHGPRDRPLIALTFDADMTETMFDSLRSGRVAGWYDPEIVRILRATDTPATIFLTGLWAEAYPEVVRDLAADPRFELANHSLDHSAFTDGCYGLPSAGSAADKRRQIGEAAATIAAIAGIRPRFFRFPGGCHSPADVQLVESLGARAVGWDVVSGDAEEQDPAAVVERVLAETQAGSIIVMHLMGAPNAPATADALERLVPALRERGFRFVRLGELLG
jgi:peptidoglycan/xylan/chitin deacetylase (PgdA/CDA1 family)